MLKERFTFSITSEFSFDGFATLVLAPVEALTGLRLSEVAVELKSELVDIFFSFFNFFRPDSSPDLTGEKAFLAASSKRFGGTIPLRCESLLGLGSGLKLDAAPLTAANRFDVLTGLNALGCLNPDT